MKTLDQLLQERLQELESASLLRNLREIDSPQGTSLNINGSCVLNFSSNDYLGLANHPHVKSAALAAIKQYGTGSGASRLISGSLAPHHQLEESLAIFKRTEAALTFSSGYATALGTISALVGPEDTVVVDRLVHASVLDAVRLSRARLRTFEHNSLEDLETELSKTRTSGRSGNILIVTESIFSMDGDSAPLTRIVELKQKHKAWLMVDEAHAIGVRGSQGRGLVQELGLGNAVEIQMGTLGKALGAAGGYICGSKSLINYLINKARSFIFTTAPSPAAAAAAKAAIDLCQSEEGEASRKKLWQNIDSFKAALNFASISQLPPESAIIPIHIGDERVATRVANQLREAGIFIPAIRFPTVARGTARLRVTLSAGHTPEQLNLLCSQLQAILQSLTPSDQVNP
ncbi:MAG: 8-amino-7-oxononanoate synthase [Verrucomicrobiota bacterium]|nr:8-amino-7-oxononanoate synthase [Verrucomicrobiota bacterium]